MTQPPRPRDADAQRSLVELTGRLYFPIAFVGRLPYSMVIIGVLTLVTTAQDSYAIGGLTSSAVGIGTATFGPINGAIADRIGQRPVLLVGSLVNALGLLSLVLVAGGELPLIALLALAFVVGASTPMLSPLSRARLVAIIDRNFSGEHHRRRFNTTMSYESMVDEINFVIGPVLAGVLAFLIAPWFPVMIAAMISVVFVGAFALHPTANAFGARHGAAIVQAPARELFRPRILVLVAGMGATGFFFGSSLASLSAFMGVYGEESQTGILYGAMGIGSAIMAISVSLFPARFSLARRWLVFAMLVLAAAVTFSSITAIPLMAVALTISGFGIGPILVTIYSLGSLRGPRGRSNTVMTMLSSGIILGQAAAVATSGAIADQLGHVAALQLVALPGAVLVLLAIVNLVAIGKPPPPIEPPPTDDAHLL